MKATVIFAAKAARLMIAQNGRPDCKNCVLAETIKELLAGNTIERIESNEYRHQSS